MTAEHFMIGDHVRSIDGRFEGTVEDRDSYGWPIVRAMFTVPHRFARPVAFGTFQKYEAPGYWRVIA